MTAKKPDTRIINRGRGHSYLLDGAKTNGVTKQLDEGFPKPALINWASETAAKYAVDHWAELDALTVSQRLDAIKGARFETLRAAGERGREVHALVHRYLLDEPVVPPDDLAGYFDAGVAFERDWHIDELAVEVAVFHRAAPDEGRPIPYGGRFDLLARLVDGHLWLLDWKTSLKGVFMEYALQLAAYRYADFYVLDGVTDDAGRAVEHPMPAVDRTGVVWLRADGSYDLVPVEAGPDALDVFTAVQTAAAFAKSDRDEWIGDALRAPIVVDDVAEAVA